jgi:hypothetical protein
MSTASHRSTSSTSSASSAASVASSSPSLPPPAPYHTVSSSIKYSLSTSTSSSSGSTNSSSSAPFQYKIAAAFPPLYLHYVQDPTPYPSSDPSAQDFDFEDLFTFTSRPRPDISTYHSSSPLQQQSSSPYVKSSNGTASYSPIPGSELPPQPQGRNRSKFSFSHYTNSSTLRPRTGTGAIQVAGQTAASRLRR